MVPGDGMNHLKSFHSFHSIPPGTNGHPFCGGAMVNHVATVHSIETKKGLY